MGYIFYYLWKHRGLLYGTNIYSRDMPGTNLTEENCHMGKIKYQFRFSSFRRGTPRKIIFNIILGLAHLFDRATSEQSSDIATSKLSYLRRYFSFHFFTLHNGPTSLYPNAQHIPLLSSTYKSLNLQVHSNNTVSQIYHCVFFSLQINSNILSTTLAAGYPPKK